MVEAINYIFCNDDYLLKINKEYLSHDTLTDIVTFELNPPGKPILSDIYISIDRVKENATLYHESFLKELLRVIFHGILHLSGFNDKKKDEKETMRKMEEQYIDEFIVSRKTVS